MNEFGESEDWSPTASARPPAGEDRTAIAREELSAMLSAVANEDREAFAALYRKTSARIFGVILRMVPDRAEAEDLLQDVYVSVWRRASAFDATRGTAMTWLITLARNRVIDRLRQSREASLDEDHALNIPADTPSPLGMAEASEARRRLEQCLQLLPPQQRNAVCEAFFSGLAYSELAERLAVPLGTVKSWIRRSLMQLKGCLEP
ncbi:sigma-70 family RNA polymerase sigma factor [Pandoraea oxalativorans]|uniref:RNA polymerase subunit sigma-24 n=1 Tax=Pandoraea oxalativorans TaxID=573737 RepID=A0A0E3YAV2_9BURK|nr:RNA polymerase subunit sigma-24 [Pandoraea oxalativorans]